MTITLDLGPDTEAVLREKAADVGLDVVAYLCRLIETEAEPDAENEAVIRLLEQWRAEDAAMTPEQAEQAEADWEELKANLNANRAATRERPLFV